MLCKKLLQRQKIPPWWAMRPWITLLRVWKECTTWVPEPDTHLEKRRHLLNLKNFTLPKSRKSSGLCFNALRCKIILSKKHLIKRQANNKTDDTDWKSRSIKLSQLLVMQKLLWSSVVTVVILWINVVIIWVLFEFDDFQAKKIVKFLLRSCKISRSTCY